MTSQSGSPEGDRSLVSVRTMEIVVALLFIAAAAVVISDSIRVGIGWRENEGPRAGYFPFYIGVIMAVASVVNLVHALRDTKSARKSFVGRHAFGQVLAVLLPLLVYVAAVAFIGIYVASVIYIALFMWHFGKYALHKGVAVGLGIAVVFFLMFEVWFLVPLPKAPWEEDLVPIIRDVFSALSRLLGI
jgi:putative tricarboxylic transport membrane protein